MPGAASPPQFVPPNAMYLSRSQFISTTAQQSSVTYLIDERDSILWGEKEDQRKSEVHAEKIAHLEQILGLNALKLLVGHLLAIAVTF